MRTRKIQSIRRALARAERGQAIVLVMLVFVGLLGAIGLAVDGGRLYSDRRSAQNAADNAALAGAFALCNSANVVNAAVASAAQNGYTAAPPNVIVSVSNPPTTGPNAGDDEYVEVNIRAQSQLTFGRLVYSGTLQSSGRAVARCTSGGGPIGGGNGLIALNDAQQRVVDLSGSGCIRVIGGGIFVNSSHSEAAYVDGGQTCGSGIPRLKADTIDVVGGLWMPEWMWRWSDPTLAVNPYPPTTGVPHMADPLATVPYPLVPSAAATPSPARCGTSGNFFLTDGNLDLTNWVNCTHPNPIIVYPGLYDRICIGSDTIAQMQPGLYYITGDSSCGGGGSFVVNGSGRVTGSDVMVFIADGGVHIGGSGQVTLAAPTSGSYAGMAIFLERENGADVRVDGAGQTLIRGTIYAANSLVSMAGSGTNKTLNAQIIAWRYVVSGSGVITVDYDPGVVFGGGGSSLIELSE